MENSRRLLGACAVLLATNLAGAQDRATPFRVGDSGISAPVLTKDVQAKYTREALEARLQGTMAMDAVVLEDGSVGDITITQPLDENKYGMDQECVKALKQWQFKPGTKDDKAVAVIVNITMTFSLK